MRSILPRKSSVEEKNLDIALGEILQRYLETREEIAKLFDFDSVLEKHLDRLAKMFAIEYWNKEWTTKQKREMLKTGMQLNRFSGSKWAVRKILEIFLPGSKAEEWYKTGKPPGVLLVKTPEMPSGKEARTLAKLLDAYKAAHTSLAFALYTIFFSRLSFFAFLHRRSYVQIRSNAFKAREFHSQISFFTIAKRRSYVRVTTTRSS